MDGTTSGCSQQRNKFPSCLAFLFNDEDSTRRGTRKEGRVKKKGRACWFNAAKRKIGNILRPSVRHRAGDEPRLPVCVLFWRTIIVLYRLLLKKSEFSDGKKKKRKEETFLNSVSSNEFPTDIWLY